MRSPIRVHADTSVFGGWFDPEFDAATQRFFEGVRRGNVRLVVSVAVRDEIARSPEHVRRLFAALVPVTEVAEIPGEATALQEAYIRHGVVSERWDADARHVAAATVLGCDAIVSWNFRHIVNLRRIRLYNEVNALEGYGPLAIHSPMEVVDDEETQEL
jgi:hypothetical protein